MCARWVPKQLTDEHNRARLETYTEFLWRYREYKEVFLHHIVTGNETWLHRYEAAKKRQSVEWKTHVILQDQEIQKCAFRRQSYVDAVLGLLWAHPGSSTARIVDRRSIVHGTVLCLKRCCNPLFAANAKD
jgi:hypothetical protein